MNMNPEEALNVLAGAQSKAPLTEAQRNACYQALQVLAPIVKEAMEGDKKAAAAVKAAAACAKKGKP